MSALFRKLNLGAIDRIVVVDAPAAFEPELARLEGVAVARKVPRAGAIAFALVFATRLAEVEAAVAALAPRMPGDPILWFAYPKATSKRHRCEFYRDTGWAALGAAGFEGVRQVAIDEDWSALRFRRVEHVKSLQRDPSRALSETGKARTQR
jgi:hypothetical protein